MGIVRRKHKMLIFFSAAVYVVIMLLYYIITRHMISWDAFIFNDDESSGLVEHRLWKGKSVNVAGHSILPYYLTGIKMHRERTHDCTHHGVEKPFSSRTIISVLSNDKLNERKIHKFTAFKTAMTETERQTLLSILRTLIRVCSQKDLTFFLYGGSLLGSYRHHDIIPWDDDVDIMMNSSQKEKVSKVLSSVNEQFQFYLSNTSTFASKFFNGKSKPLPHQPFRWPYVDIFFFEENSTHIFDELPQYKADFSFPKTHVFPLIRRPFAGDLVPAPFDTSSVLDKNYTPLICKPSSFSHKLETYFEHRSKSIPCKHLHGIHPFVFRDNNSSAMDHHIKNVIGRHRCKRNETLKIGQAEIYTLSIETSHCDGEK